MKQKLIGAWGEALAAEYLQSCGYVVVSMGYRCRFGEVDIIVTDKKYIVFVEVKTRTSKHFAEAREFVTRHKIERLRRAAEMWLSAHETTRQPRFDVIEIYAPQGVDTTRPEITHLEDAFQ